MEGGVWKSRIDSALTSAGRDAGEMYRQVATYLGHLNTMERLILVGLAMISLFYLLVSHVSRRQDREHADVRFVGMMLLVVAFQAGVGWMIASDGRA